MKKVIAVVVTYNRKELLKECINALLSQNYKNCDILVVDNNSTDGTKGFIKEELKNKRVFYKNTGKNLGGAGGFNFGIKEAYKMGCDYVWVMDDDCIVRKDSLTKLLSAAKKLDYDFGFLSSKVIWKDGSICKMNIQKKNIVSKNEDWSTEIVKIEMATFVSCLFPSKIVKEIGLPISEFFIWADDLEYTRRISRRHKCYLINSSVVVHKSKNNIGSNIAVDDLSNLERYKYAYRNERYVLNREGIKGKFYYNIKILLHKLRVTKANRGRDREKKIDVINEAAKRGRTFRPTIEYIEE